jgi:hypothetical protein
MSRRIVAVGIAAAAAAAFAIGVKAETGSRLGFAVENDTASTIVGLDVASLSTGAWRRADLDHANLKPGDSVQAHADRAGCEYDVRARLKTGAVIRQDDVDLCDLDSDTLVIEG